jgi:prepilin-type N-terminal cleavage/methylation domain-containing protein
VLRNEKGFTLIELVMVIVILGVLSAFVLPRFSDLSRESRIATLEGLSGALSGALATGRALCATSNDTCGLDVDGGSVPYFVFNSQQVFTHYGAPTGWGQFGVDDAVGSIATLMEISEQYEYQAHVGGTFETRWQLRDAPDPANCYVSYQMTHNSPRVDITVHGTGC